MVSVTNTRAPKLLKKMSKSQLYDIWHWNPDPRRTKILQFRDSFSCRFSRDHSRIQDRESPDRQVQQISRLDARLVGWLDLGWDCCGENSDMRIWWPEAPKNTYTGIEYAHVERKPVGATWVMNSAMIMKLWIVDESRESLKDWNGWKGNQYRWDPERS